MEQLLVGMEAVVVAHPDDETLWGAGHIIRTGCDVICCTVPRRDPERAIRFFDAVRVLGGFPILIPFMESPPNEDLTHLDVLDLSRYDKVYTHNKDGEYGHRHHRNVHDFVMQNYHGSITTFGFGKGEWSFQLTPQEQAQKLQALQCYDNYSNADGGKPKWQALLDTYHIDLEAETYDVVRDKGQI